MGENEASRRLDADGALKHVWLLDTIPISARRHGSFDDEMFTSLKAFKSEHRLKRVALHAIATRLSNQKVHELREIFKTLDRDENGILTVEELANGIAQAGLAESDI